MNPIFSGRFQVGTGVAPTGGMNQKFSFNEVPENATPAQKRELAKIKKLSTDYESFFMKEVVSAMRKTVQKADKSGDGNADEIFQGMLDDQFASGMAVKGNTGIAQGVYNKLSDKYLAQAKVNKGVSK